MNLVYQSNNIIMINRHFNNNNQTYYQKINQMIKSNKNQLIKIYNYNYNQILFNYISKILLMNLIYPLINKNKYKIKSIIKIN